MKHLILSILACLFLCTACFEKEEIEKEEEEVEVVPPEVDILECDRTQRFITGIQNGEPREPRATVKKYLKGSENIFGLDMGGDPAIIFSTIGYCASNCEFICSNAFGASGGQPCNSTFLDSLVYVETVWKDER